jgi:hypothetical protein
MRLSAVRPVDGWARLLDPEDGTKILASRPGSLPSLCVYTRSRIRRVAAVAAGELDLVGIGLRADRKTVDKVVDRLRPHP